MKSKENTLKILLDTSFILPTLGIDTGKNVIKTLEKIDNINAEIYFSMFSVLEGIWIAIRFIKKSKFNEQSFRNGLKAIMRYGRYIKILENEDIIYGALDLYRMNHKDIIDNILYMDSVYFDLRLLTLDNELRNFIRSNKLKDTLIFPDEL